MSVAKDVVDFVAANSAFVIGTDLFLGKLQLGDDTGVTIMETIGHENETNMVSQGIRIMAFYNDYLAAQMACQTVYNLIAYNNGFISNSNHYFNCVPMNTPNLFSDNIHGKVVFAATFVVYRER